MNPSSNHAETSPLPTRSVIEGHGAPPEVRAFLQQIKGKDPDELLATADQGSLSVAMIQASILTAIALVACTVGPYALGMMAHAGGKAEPAKTETKVETAEPTKAPPAPTTATTAAPTTDKSRPTTSKEFIDKIGVNDVKPANPKVNPLDKSTEDLFKDIDKK